MSKRGNARHRAERYKQQRLEQEGEQHLDAMQPRPSPLEQIERAKKVESQQPRINEQKASSVFSSIARWALSAMSNEPSARASVRVWDAWYREQAQQEPFLAGIFNGAVLTDVNRGWTVTGGSRQVKTVTDTLKNFDRYVRVGNKYVLGASGGWRSYLAWQSESYYATRLGFASELGRSGAGGPLFTIWSVDPARCELTGNNEKPMRYYPSSGGPIEFYYDQYFRKCSLISTNEDALGYGLPAVARCYQLAKIMMGVLWHYQSKLGTRTPDGFLTGANISEEQFKVAMQARKESLDADPSNYLNSIATLLSSGPDKPILELLMLSNLPDRWDLDLWLTWLVRGYENAFGYHGEYSWENAGVLGRGNEVQTQHRTATSIGGKDFILQHQGELQEVLPPTIEFLYDERDVQGDIEEAQAKLTQAQVITEMTKWAALTPDEIKELAAEQGLIPEEWTVTPDEATATDEEDAETAEQAAGMSERVYRAMQAFPDEPIVRYHWPTGKTTILWTVRRSVHFVPKVFGRMQVERSVESVAAGYREQLQAITDDALAGGNPDEIAARHRELILATALLAFVAGMQSGGVSGDEMTAAEKAIVAGWTATQLAHVDQYSADAVAAGQDPAERDKIMARLELWVAAILALGGQGLMSANGDAMGTWRLGATERHCRTCANLHGKRHRLSWYKSRGLIPREPGSASLECKGYRCDCSIVDDKGNQLL